MNKVIGYSNTGGVDLYNGVPNLNGAKLVQTNLVEVREYVGVLLTFELSNGETFGIEIRQEVV